MELLTGRLPLQEPETDRESNWEAQSTGRSSNEGCEAWVAKDDGGFRLKGAPPTPAPTPQPAPAPVASERERGRAARKGRGRSKERRSSRPPAPVQTDAADATAADAAEAADADEGSALPAGELRGRRKEAAASVARQIASALKLTPGTQQLVSRAAVLGAAAAVAMPPTPDGAADEEREALGEVSNREKKKGKRAKAKGGKKASKKDKEQLPTQLDLSV
jgi:hypothetical protein